VTAEELRKVFDAPAPYTLGVEEEVILVDPVTLQLAESNDHVLGGPVKREMPVSQVEVATTPVQRVSEAIAQLRAGRELIARRGTAIAAGIHPLAPPVGALNTGERYDAILAQYADVAYTQLVCALQVHVAVGSAEATLAVHNALRSHLPELAALAANAPFYAGRDTGFASVRPLVAALLPRQGVPPEIPSWEAFEEMLGWAGDPKTWWFEVRPHLRYGTLELRVCDAQTTLAEAAPILAFVHALIVWLAERGGGPVHDTWRIAENRFLAARHGLDAVLVDLDTGERRPVRDLLAERVRAIMPTAEKLGCAQELSQLSLEANGAHRQRAAGLDGVTRWLADRFLA